MRHFTLSGLLGLSLLLLLSVSTTFAQDDPAAADADAGGDEGGEEGGEGEAKEEECEEAWDYVEFLKASIKDKVELILQETLFQPRPLLEETVTKTVEQVLEMRDDILTRTKSIRTNDGEVLICPEQNIKQEEFLTLIRMQVMTVLLNLIEKEAATPEALQDVGKLLLAIRTKTNTEITRMIMLKEAGPSTRSTPTGDCDCGILGETLEGLDAVVNMDKGDDKEEGGDDDDAAVTDAEEGEATAGAAEGGEGEDPVAQLTMILMSIDGEIKTFYNQIIGELDDEARRELGSKLEEHKQFSTALHEVLSELSELDPEKNKEAIAKLIKRDVRAIMNDVKRTLSDCQQNCPGECDSCGAEKIMEVSDKLTDYKQNLEDLDEQEAKDTIRTDLMTFLDQINKDMTELLTKKAQEDKLDECDAEQLEVINKIKGPLWMMVNITIFGDAATMGEMIDALESALTEMRSTYCSDVPDADPVPYADTLECDLNEINTARDWITDIDTVISEDIFKNEDDDSRRKAMLGLIELKSGMDDRVRDLFQDNLACKEEVEQIKNIYAQKVTECLAEMMNPRFRFDLLARAERVQCVKDLRILMEDRRGVLLMREITARINEAGVDSVGGGEGEEAQ